MSDKPPRKNVPLLIDEPPILVYPALAEAIGINEAIIFQQLHFLLNITRQAKAKYNLYQGEWWVYNSYPEWQEYFPWLAQVTIKRLFLWLEKQGLVKSIQSVKNKSDRRKWYTINYDKWLEIHDTIVSKRSHEPSYQKDTIIVSKRADGYTETTSEEIEKDIAPNGAKSTTSKKPRPRNPYFDAIVDAFGYDPKLTESNAGLIRKVAKELKDAGYTPEQIPLIHAYCVRQAKAQNWKPFKAGALSGHADNWRRDYEAHKPKPVASTPRATPPADEPAPLEDFMVYDDAGRYVGMYSELQGEGGAA